MRTIEDNKGKWGIIKENKGQLRTITDNKRVQVRNPSKLTAFTKLAIFPFISDDDDMVWFGNQGQ